MNDFKEIKKLEIEKSDDGISFSYLDDKKKLHIMTNSYGEVTSTSLNKTEVKRIVKWLNKYLNFIEGESEKQ